MSAIRSIKVVVMGCIKSLGCILFYAIKQLAGALIKVVLCATALLICVVFFIYMTADSTNPQMVPLLTALVTTTNENRISYFQDQDWCESLLSEAGNYANSAVSTCGVGDETKPFDVQGTELFTKVRYAAKKAKLAPISISIRSEQGRVSFAQIDLPCFYCYAFYIYSPQEVYNPDKAEKALVTHMGGDWYYVTTSI
ncbi:hypothetical protein [Pseudomonas sp. H3(2019)]|uniref:hypothetical protein n=1 Tax=Pseudomonas sp. H3(2019) TaxID=2598724 RepID=UPI0011924C81|nr:hypothetical protein [Pseudomonas sp. H3(2019)]TVT79593.1 hypothetical protein FPT12_26075 [Pseudomonas sp. H3(2019)]